MNTRSSRAAVFMAAVLCLCQGCPFAPSNLDLVHEPVRVKCAPGHRVLLQVPADQRLVRDRIGVKKDGYGVEHADIYLSGNVLHWVFTGFKLQFEAAGVTVVTDSGGASGGEVAVRPTIKLFFVEPKVSFTQSVHAQVMIELVVEFPDGRRYARLFKGYDKSVVLLYLDSVFISRLEAAAQEVFGKAVFSVCKLLEAQETR